MANLKTREKRKLQRQKKQEKKALLQKQLEELDNLPDDDEGEEDEGLEQDSESSVEVETKEYDTPFYGPTTFDELDAMEEAREKAHAVRQVTYNVQDMVYNILCSPNMDPKEKGSAISKLGAGFSKRVEKIMSTTPEMKHKELDIRILEIDALIARDKRNMGFVEKAGSWMAKSVSSPKALDNLSDEQFALVIQKENGNERKFPVHDKLHTRLSLKEASRIAKELSETDNLEAYEQVIQSFDVLKKKAKEFEIGLQESKNSVIVEKDISGNWRAVLLPTNNFMDREGEIFTEAAHQEYVEWVNKNMDCAPIFVTWHLSGTQRESPVDFVGYQNGFVVMSVPLTEKEARNILEVQTKVDIGMSHGTLVLEKNASNNNVIEKYRMVEVSDLPLERAANPFTTLQLVTKEVVDMDTKEYLEKMLGAERAQAYIEKIGLKQKDLRAQGVQEKEVKTPDSPATPDATLGTTPDLKSIIEAVSKEFDMPALSEEFGIVKSQAEKVPVLEALVKEMSEELVQLKQADDTKLAQKISPPAGPSLTWKRASQSDSTILKENKEDEILQKSVPETGWLSEATKTEPVAA